MSPIGIICDGKILGQGHKVSMKKKIEITIFQLENKQRKNDRGGQGRFYLQKDS
jgi:hypothetical protein